MATATILFHDCIDLRDPVPAWSRALAGRPTVRPLARPPVRLGTARAHGHRRDRPSSVWCRLPSLGPVNTPMAVVDLYLDGQV